MRFIPWIYAALCAASLALFVAGMRGVAGEDSDPLSVAGILLGMAINFPILNRLTRRFRKPSSTLS